MKTAVAIIILAVIIIGAFLFYYGLSYFGCSVYPKDQSVSSAQSVQMMSPTSDHISKQQRVDTECGSPESKPEPISIQINGEPLYGSTDALQGFPQPQPYDQQVQYRPYNQMQYQPPSLPMPTYTATPHKSTHSPSAQ